MEGSWGAEFCDEVKSVMKESDVIITKNRYSCWMGTELQERLRKDIDTVVVGGVTFNNCVRASIVDGYHLGFRVIEAQFLSHIEN